MSYQVLWAGPWPLHRAAQASQTAAISPQELTLGQQIFAANCAACHGAAGTGGVGPNLHGIAANKSLSATIAFIENPTGGMTKLYPGTLTAQQVTEVANYIRDTFK